MISSPDPHAPQPIDYASVPPPRRRVSKLAVASLVLAVLSSPCLLSPLDDVLDGGLTPALQTPWFLPLLWTLVLAISIVAIVRVSRFKETKTGKRFAVLALLICLTWMALMVIVLSFGIPGPD